MSWNGEFDYYIESARQFMKEINCGVSPKKYGMAIKRKTKKKKRR